MDRVRAIDAGSRDRELIVSCGRRRRCGSFNRQFDRMAEVTGRAADQIIAAHRVARVALALLALAPLFPPLRSNGACVGPRRFSLAV